MQKPGDEKGCLNTQLPIKGEARRVTLLAEGTKLDQKKVRLHTRETWRSISGMQMVHLGVSQYSLIQFDNKLTSVKTPSLERAWPSQISSDEGLSHSTG